MAGMMVNIGANVQSATKGIKDVSLLLSDQKAILKQLQLEYAKLDTAAARSKSGQLIANDIKIAKAEIQRLGTVSTNSFGEVGKGATKALSGIRTLAHILPGLGIAGIFNVVFSGIAALFNNTSEAADKLKKKLDELIRPLSEIQSAATAGTEEALVKVQALSTAVLDQSLSYEKRNRALAQLKEINKEYFGDLTVETAMLGGLKSAVDEYTNAIIANAVIKAFSEDIGKLSVELAKQVTDYNKASDAVDKYARELDKVKGQVPLKDQFSIDIQNKAITIAEGNLRRAKSALSLVGGTINQLSTQSGALRTALQAAVTEALKFKPLTGAGGKPDPIVLKPKVEIRPELGSIDITLPTFLDPKEDLRSRLSKQLSALFTELNLKIPVGIDLDTPGKSFQNLQKLVSGKIDVIRDKLIADIKSINEAIKNLVVDSLANVGDAIGTALGGGDIKNVFQNFANIVGSGLQAIGKQLIAIGVAALLAKEALKKLFANPAIAIAAGVALVAAGAALKSALSGGIQAREAGGPVQAGMPYLVGERRAEIFVPNTSGRILPNTRMSPVSGGAAQSVNVHVTGSIDGKVIKLTQARQNAYDRRNV